MDNENFKDLDCEILNESKFYIKAYDEYIKLKKENIVKKIKGEYPGFFKLLGTFIITSIIIALILTMLGGDEAIAGAMMIYSVFIAYKMIINPFARRGKTKEKLEIFKNKIGFNDKGFIKFYFETKMNIKSKVLGQTFFVKNNEITGTQKREYYGDISVILPEQGANQYILVIHFSKTNMLCRQNFLISDIIGFVTLSHEGLGDIRGHSKIDTFDLERAEQHALDAERDVAVSRITGTGAFHSNVRADYARSDAREEMEELQKEIKNEEKRIQDDTFIKLLKFKNGNSFLISHLDESTVSTIGNAIENVS